MLSCVVNLSEGRDRRLVDEIAARAGPYLLDVHSDAEHHRSVLTIAAASATACEQAVAAVVTASFERLSLERHVGVHPRLGVVDVVPFVPLLAGASAEELAHADLGEALEARGRLAAFVARSFDVPCFLYGAAGEPSLPTIRREAFTTRPPDLGPSRPHARLGALCAGARRVLVAYNVVLAGADLFQGRELARELRSPDVRSLAFALAAGVQISCNLVAPWRTSPLELVERLEQLSAARHVAIARTELVGLIPEAILERIPPAAWARLDLDATRTLEARFRRRLEPAR